MENHILPTRLYKLVPVIYLGLGIYIWVKLDTVYALVAGAMMAGAGLLAVLMRRGTTEDFQDRPNRQRASNRGNVDEGHEDKHSASPPPLTGISVAENVCPSSGTKGI